MTEKRDREQDSTEGKKTVMGSGREKWRKKEILRKREKRRDI